MYPTPFEIKAELYFLMPNYKIELFVYTAILFQDTVKSSSSVAGKVTGKVVI